jgi:lincosamide nucleotidyltransferase A/C/D/E
MVSAEDVISLYQNFSANNIQVWLTGGWGIDALLGRQTRPHKDLDIIVLVDDVVRIRELLKHAGYTLKELWSENRQTVDSEGNEVPTAFVLRDAPGREADIHALRLDEQGNGVPVWTNDEGLIFKTSDLAGEGLIAGFPVGCLSPQMQVVRHTGYHLPEVQQRDLDLLDERFRVG